MSFVSRCEISSCVWTPFNARLSSFNALMFECLHFNARLSSLNAFREQVRNQLQRLEALQQANDKYPWVASWHKASLLELEVGGLGF
jgi:hypothetical protein